MLCERTRGDAEKTWRSSHGKEVIEKAEVFQKMNRKREGFLP